MMTLLIGSLAIQKSFQRTGQIMTFNILDRLVSKRLVAGRAVPVLAAVAATILSTSTHASVVPTGNQQLSYYIYQNGTLVPDTNVGSNDLSSPLGWVYPSPPSVGLPYGSAVANALSVPRVEVSAATPRYVDSASFAVVRARSALAYYVSVNGPDLTLDIPVAFSARLWASVPGNADINAVETAIADFTIQEYSGIPDVNTYLGAPIHRTVAAQNRYTGSGETGYLGLVDGLSVRSGTYLGVILAAAVQVQGGGSASAWVDPYFYIDPSFLSQHPGYALNFSPFVGNDPSPPAVPEPSTWAMLFGGFGLVGFAMRRARAKALA